MNTLIAITLSLAVLSVEPTLAKPVRPQHSYEDYSKFVQDVKKTIIIERSYRIGTEQNLVLAPGRAARLDFEDNPSGVKEFIFFYNDETVYLAYRYSKDTEKQYQGTRLCPEKKKSFRGTRETKEGPWLWLFYEFEPKDGKAFVKFRATEQLSEKDREQIKQIEEMKRRSNAGSSIDTIVEQLREKVSREIHYEFGTVEEVTIVPDQDAIRLNCSDNPENVKEILIGASSEHLFIYCVLSSGSVKGGGSTWQEVPGSFRQVGGSAAIGMWERHDDRIHVRFQLTDDDNAIIQSYRKLGQAAKSFPKRRFSQAINNWADILDHPEALFPGLTTEQRVEAFVRLWSTVKFNFANFDLVPELNWDDVLSEYLPKVMQDQSNDKYILLIRECMALLKDGHTSVSSSWGDGLPTACPPLEIRSAGGKAIVTKITETEEIKSSCIKPGDEITHVDGRPVQELLKKDIYPYICASTPQGRDLEAYPRILHGPKESRVSLSIKTPTGAVHEVSLTRKAGSRALLPRSRPKSVFEYRDLGDGIACVALNSFGDSSVVDSFNEKFKQISRAKGLIIDVRKNHGGSSRHGHAIIARLIDKAIPATRWKTPQYRAAFRAWGRDEQWYDGGSKIINPETDEPFLGPVVVLIGPETNSAAEDFVVPLHAAGRATIVGQKSRGSTGQPLQFSFLDGKIGGRVCTKRDQYPDGREFVGVGIIPDVEVHPTPADIAASRDVVLEKGVSVLKSKLM
ncbi:MAG TPA: S41 family peptidase [Sedimentisphaerales bacterium]|nr:S41 family peptidase [Sedimentisphaerales bacterium]